MINNKIIKGILILLLSASACLANAAEKITVYAAASLTNAIEEISATYQKAHPVTIVSSFASSSTLARQIKEGAPVELFISADQRWMDYLAESNLIKADSRVTLLSNQLVLIAPRDSKLQAITLDKKTDWTALLQNGHLAVGDPDHVPVGNYAKQALTWLGAWEQLSPKLARTNNVRAALALVEQGEAPLGIVYSSDVVVTDKVKIIATFPTQSHEPVTYPMALIAGRDNAAAQAFSQYLQGPEAAKVFNKYGFAVTQ
ncbi:MAG: molybdate ABC transporter substrate-binding protein [Enterobacteriaceae bacterium]